MELAERSSLSQAVDHEESQPIQIGFDDLTTTSMVTSKNFHERFLQGFLFSSTQWDKLEPLLKIPQEKLYQTDSVIQYQKLHFIGKSDSQ